jgi:hypothetical protein
VVTGSLVSGGAIGVVLPALIAHLPPPWKDIAIQLIPAATSAISGLVYAVSRIAMKYWLPKRFHADREAVIRKCDERLIELHEAKTKLQKGRSARKEEHLKEIGQAIELVEHRKVLAQIAEYPERRWEGREAALATRKKKSGTAE